MAVQTAPRTDDAERAPEPTAQMPATSPGLAAPAAPATALPVPVGAPVRTEEQEQQRRSLRDRLAGKVQAAAREPFAVIAHVRVVMALLLTALCLLTAAGALLFLMAWRQQQTSGLLIAQTDRLWDVWDLLAQVEQYVALAAAPIVGLWLAVATLNVRRATGRRRNPVLSVVVFAAGVVGAWVAADRVVMPALDNDDWVGTLGGLALQAVAVALPLLVLERLADAAEARHRPARVACVTTFGFLAVIEVSGSLATIEPGGTMDSWGRSGALVLIAALIEIIAVLAFSEAARALEEGTQHRYELRHRFGETVLMQAGL